MPATYFSVVLVGHQLFKLPRLCGVRRERHWRGAGLVRRLLLNDPFASPPAAAAHALAPRISPTTAHPVATIAAAAKPLPLRRLVPIRTRRYL
eukprot:1821709-Pleurochrysis_carterae.AAC.3